MDIERLLDKIFGKSVLEDPRDSFYAWLKDKRKLYFYLPIGILISLISSTTLPIPWLKDLMIEIIGGKYRDILPEGLNLLVILLLFFTKLFRIKLPQTDNTEFKDFAIYWRGLWCSWFLFYLFIFAQHIFQMQPNTAIVPSVMWTVGSNFLNNLQALFLFLCFFVLAEFRVTVRPVIPLAGVLITLTLFDFFNPEAISFQIISGAAVGLSMALFVGQLERKFFGSSNTLIISAFYFYAIIQFSYAMFQLREITMVKEIMLSLALPLKMLLFAFVQWVMWSQRLSFYFQQRTLLREIEAQWIIHKQSTKPLY